MLKYRVPFVIALATVLVVVSSAPSEETWRLERGRDWKSVLKQGRDYKFRLAITEADKLVETGQCKAAEKAYRRLKIDFPEIVGPDSDDLDIFTSAELLRCRGKLKKAVKMYDKLLEDPNSGLYEAALDREFRIAQTLLAGRKTRLLGIFFKVTRYSQGVRIMEKITDELAPYDSAIGMDADVEVAKSYEQRGRSDRTQYESAYVKWSEIFDIYDEQAQIAASQPTGQVGKDSLLGMARCKEALFKGPQYDTSDLVGRPFNPESYSNSAEACYKRFQEQYSEDAKKFRVAEKVKGIDEQRALKQYKVGEYYEKRGNKLAANLYYDMVIRDWSGSEIAKLAKKAKQRMIEESLDAEKGGK